MTGSLTLICHGSRGSMPVAGPDVLRYGGLTTLYEVVVEPGRRLLLDMGTGVHHLLPTLDTEVDRSFDIFFSHVHWDHMHGLPFFRPLYDERNLVTFHATPHEGRSTEEMVSRMMEPPWFPVPFDASLSSKRFDDLDGTERVVAGITIKSTTLHHPSGVTGYRFEMGGKSIVVATDVEPAPWSDELLVDLARGADVFVHDAQYLTDEYEREKIGWGHSTWRDSVRIAEEAGVGRLIITSHDPNRSDDEVDAIVADAGQHLPTEGAYPGLVITA